MTGAATALWMIRRNVITFYTEDAGFGTPYCVCVQDLMATLQGTRFHHLREQVAVFDACANPFADSGETNCLHPPRSPCRAPLTIR